MRLATVASLLLLSFLLPSELQATRRIRFRQPEHALVKDSTSRVIIINVPARKLRGYMDGKMVYERPVAVGRNSYPGVVENTKTRLGSYKIRHWYSNYRTKDYPVPWTRSEWQGAFGIHTAILEPDALYQHLHGTVGPVELRDWIVERTSPRLRRPDENEQSYRRYLDRFEYGLSHGCTRVSNQTITELREQFPVGTVLHKVYALVERYDPAETGGIEERHFPNIYRYEDSDNGIYDVSRGVLIRYHHPEDNYHLGPALPPKPDENEAPEETDGAEEDPEEELSPLERLKQRVARRRPAHTGD